jgi:hypothetical protein
METSNVASSSRTVNSASVEGGESFNSRTDEGGIGVKGAFRFNARAQSMLKIFLTDSTAIPTTSSALQSALALSTLSITPEHGKEESSQQVTRMSDGDTIRVSDEQTTGVDEDGTVDFSTLASDFIDSFWTLDAMTTLLQGEPSLSCFLPFLS